jgi:hypothetical protein
LEFVAIPPSALRAVTVRSGEPSYAERYVYSLDSIRLIDRSSPPDSLDVRGRGRVGTGRSGVLVWVSLEVLKFRLENVSCVTACLRTDVECHVTIDRVASSRTASYIIASKRCVAEVSISTASMYQ